MQLDEVSARTDLAAVCLTGKPFIFAVGADLTAVPQATERSQALELGKEGHRVFNRFSELKVPTFAFINGAAMGGGLEIALHCNYRTVSADAAAIALPECFLGLVPGWEERTYCRTSSGRQGCHGHCRERTEPEQDAQAQAGPFELGIADALFEPADFIEQSLYWAVGSCIGDRKVERAAVDRGEAWDAAVARGRQFVAAKVGSAAPRRFAHSTSSNWRRPGTKEECFAAEDEALADLVMSEELRAACMRLTSCRNVRSAQSGSRQVACPQR